MFQGLSLRALVGTTLAVASITASAFAGTPTHHEIVIVTGQSNARPQFASGVIEGLLASGEMPDAELFHAHHSGNWMNRWVAGEPGSYQYAANFLSDLWNPDGTALLQQRIADIENAGESWSIEGFIWFQGEGDSGSPLNRSLYAGRFMHMLRSIEILYATPNDVRAIVTKIDFNGDVEALAQIGGRTPADIESIRDIQQSIADADATIEAFDSRGWPRFDVWHVGDRDDPRGLYGMVRDLGEAESAAFLEIPRTAGRADLNADGVLDLADAVAFGQAFTNGQPSADLAAPVGVIDLADVNAFVALFLGN